jgi:hypothetical protein
MDTIKSGTLLSDDQLRMVRAALVLRGFTRRDFADEADLSLHRVNQMMGRTHTVTEPYADAFNELVSDHLIEPIQAAA